MSGADHASAVASRLRVALERLASALTRPSADDILACEADIETVLGELQTLRDIPAGSRALVRAELQQASSALLRCRRLGAALGDYVRLTLDAQGHQSGYGPRISAPVFSGQTLNTKA